MWCSISELDLVCSSQVLLSVACQIEQYAASNPDFPELVCEAAQFLLLKDQALKEQGVHRPVLIVWLSFCFIKLKPSSFSSCQSEKSTCKKTPAGSWMATSRVVHTHLFLPVPKSLRTCGTECSLRFCSLSSWRSWRPSHKSTPYYLSELRRSNTPHTHETWVSRSDHSYNQMQTSLDIFSFISYGRLVIWSSQCVVFFIEIQSPVVLGSKWSTLIFKNCLKYSLFLTEIWWIFF